MVGVDLVHVKRMERFYEKFGQKAYGRFLCEDEIKLVKSPQSAAGFWAIKEAASKALGCGIGGICGFKDICIHKDDKGKPFITLSKVLIDRFFITDIDVSVSHDSDFAIAVVAIEGLKSKRELFH